MSGSVLESVLELQRQRADQAEAAYRQLVELLAANPRKAPTPEAVDAVLIAARRSVDDLDAAVRLAQRRDNLRAEISSIDARADDRAELAKKIEVAKAELQAAQDRYRETVFPMEREIESINQLHHRRASAERELRDTMSDDAADELFELGRAIRSATRDYENQKRLVADLRARLGSPDEDVRLAAPGQVERGEGRLSELKAAVDDLVQRQAELLKAALNA
jgi:DNA repair exonuclease SbcCD ATPase subunit